MKSGKVGGGVICNKTDVREVPEGSLPKRMEDGVKLSSLLSGLINGEGRCCRLRVCTENYPAVRKRGEKSLRGGVGPGWAGWVPGQLQWEAQARPKLRRDDGASAVSETMSKAQGSRGIVEKTRRGV